MLALVVLRDTVRETMDSSERTEACRERERETELSSSFFFGVLLSKFSDMLGERGRKTIRGACKETCDGKRMKRPDRLGLQYRDGFVSRMRR